MTEIIPRLYVGTIVDAQTFWGKVLCVLNQWPYNGNPLAVWIPVVVADADNLEKSIQALLPNLRIAADLIDEWRKDNDVLVHCREGIERSPLLVAYYLTRHGHASGLSNAYALIRSLRPEILDRSKWL